MKAMKIDARSPDAKKAGVIGAKYDAFGNIIGGKDVNTGSEVRGTGGGSTLDRKKAGQLTPALNAFEAGMKPMNPARSGRFSPRPGDTDFVGPVTPAQRANVTKTAWDMKREASDAREVNRKDRAAGLEDWKRERIATVAKAGAERTARNAEKKPPTAFDAGRIAEAGNRSRTQDPSVRGLSQTVKTPYGNVTVRDGKSPAMVAAKAPGPASGVAMPPGGPSLNPGVSQAPTAATLATTRGTMPAQSAFSKAGEMRPQAPGAAPQPTAPKVPAAVAANQAKLRTGDATAAGMAPPSWGDVAKAGRAVLGAGKAVAQGIAEGYSNVSPLAIGAGATKTAFDGVRDFQKNVPLVAGAGRNARPAAPASNQTSMASSPAPQEPKRKKVPPGGNAFAGGSRQYTGSTL